MSGILDDTHSNNAHSTAPPRKRSRQDSACDPESSPASSDGGGESGSSVIRGSMEDDDREDSRRAGSQKRARSEGLGESDNARGSMSWSRGAPLPSAETTRHFGGRTTSEHPSVTSLISFPVAPRCEVQREPEGSNSSRQGGTNSSSVVYTAQNDLARTMAFDQQIDALRRSPPPISLSPSLASQTASTADTTSDLDLGQREQSVALQTASLNDVGETRPSPASETRSQTILWDHRILSNSIPALSQMHYPQHRQTSHPPQCRILDYGFFAVLSVFHPGGSRFPLQLKSVPRRTIRREFQSLHQHLFLDLTHKLLKAGHLRISELLHPCLPYLPPTPPRSVGTHIRRKIQVAKHLLLVTTIYLFAMTGSQTCTMILIPLSRFLSIASRSHQT
ncbi:hypothetical protein JB92DRAFT_1058819 [Gautieria morchelliformis]|nr:hypothetical protein JB92DRAFT_1058819 [Gautieria morchelliformis]